MIRTTIAAALSALVASSAMSVPAAHAAPAAPTPVPVYGAWHGSLRWTENFADAPVSSSVSYCGTTVTAPSSVTWHETVAINPFAFTLSRVGLTSATTDATGSVAFTVTTNIPATVDGSENCPAETDVSSGSFSGSSQTVVGGEAESGGPYIQVYSSPAGSLTYPQSGGWAGTLTTTSPRVNGGQPSTVDLLWFPRVAVDVEIQKDDSGTWSGVMPGTNFFQQHNGASDAFVDGSYNPYYYGTPGYYGLHASANSTLVGPATSPPTTKIISSPAKSSTSKTAKFRFTSNDKSATFSCTIDGKKAKACTSPMTYKKLKVGKHTFSVDATDPASGLADPKPAKKTWKIKKK